MTDTGGSSVAGRPIPQDSAGTESVAARATASLAAIERASMRLLDAMRAMDDTSLRQPSVLPGWSRAHVITHLARNADGCVNLLLWARTGVEHAMYPSSADREAAIREGAAHSHWLLEEDLIASGTRFAEACREMPASAWFAEVAVSPGNPIRAHEVLRSRLLELWVHLADLDCGFGFEDIPEPDIECLLEDAVRHFACRPDMRGGTVEAIFSNGRRRTWDVGRPDRRTWRVAGAAGPMLGWLLGRTGSEALEGEAPELPAWL